MERPFSDKQEQAQEISNEVHERRYRPRGMTTLKLQWLAERVRKTKRIKEAVAAGEYKVDSREVASTILNLWDKVS